MYLSPTEDIYEDDTDELFPFNLNKEEFGALIACIPTLNERCSDLESKFSSMQVNYSNLENKHVLLENKYSELDGKYSSILKENSLLKKQLESHSYTSHKNINKVNQYSRRNNLCAHRLRNVPTNLHGTKFSKYVAAELRRNIPGLTISHEDIDTSHVLFYESVGNLSLPVVVIKFVNRDLRNDIFHYGKNESSNIFFTEHLTVDNRKLFEEVQRRCLD